MQATTYCAERLSEHKKGGDFIFDKEKRIAAYNNYAQLRDAKGLTDYAVCKASGVATSTMSSWKNGRYIPKYEKLSLVFEVVGGSISDILGKEDGARAKQEHNGKDHS